MPVRVSMPVGMSVRVPDVSMAMAHAASLAQPSTAVSRHRVSRQRSRGGGERSLPGTSPSRQNKKGTPEDAP